LSNGENEAGEWPDWDLLYCHLAASLGWTWEQIDDMTLPRLYAFNRYWENHPPVHIMVAAYFGIKAKPEKKKETSEEMIAELAGMGFQINGL
jgi:hypothetical protein